MIKKKNIFQVPLCGHATLAAATVIYRVAGNTNQLISFSTKSGILTAEKDGSMIGITMHAELIIKKGLICSTISKIF